ncbi:MAG: hypothetical protein ABI772_14135 [Bacteroidota bacterium]
MRKLLLIITFIFFNLYYAFAQYEINYPSWYPATTFKNLYMVCGDTNDIYAKEVIEIVRQNWKVTPVILLPPSIKVTDNLLLKGNLFLSVTSYSKTLTKGSGDLVSANDYFHLDVWTVKDVYKEGKEFGDYGFIIGSAELYNKTIGMGVISRSSGEDFTSILFQNDFLNGMKGNIKNIIQFFNSEIPKGNDLKLLQDHTPTAEIANLKNDTLYVPNYWYGAEGTMIEKEKPGSSDYVRTEKYIAKMIASYPYKVKLLTRTEMNHLILNADKNIYYVNYIQSSADKIVSVTNGFTGAVVYSVVNRKSYRIKDSDLENIGKAVTDSFK